jgi:predicted PurR-regulated permease PerM
LTKTLTSLADAILVTVVLWIIGVDFALLWGFVTFVLNFIPNIGSIIATILPFVASLLQFNTLAVPLLVLFLLGSIQMLMGNVVEPRWMASSLNLSALLVLFSLIFWGWLWGGLGMILAVPLTSTLKIIFENVNALKPIAILMSGHVPKPELADPRPTKRPRKSSGQTLGPFKKKPRDTAPRDKAHGAPDGQGLETKTAGKA